MIIYLDQNKWIDLARAYHNRDDGRDYVIIKDKILKCSEDGKHTFPLSIVHLLETYAAKRSDRRIRLAEVMTMVSNLSVAIHRCGSNRKFMGSLYKSR
jgi:hypothetical protein